MDRSTRRVHVWDEDRAGTSTGVVSPTPVSAPESPAETSSRSQTVRLQDADVLWGPGDEGFYASQSSTMRDIEAVLDQKERDMAAQFQRLREQVSQVLGGQGQPILSNAAAFSGWQGQSSRRTSAAPAQAGSPPRPERLGLHWSALGQPMMAALWKNRDLESEHRRLLEEVARKRAELRALRPRPPLPQARSTPNLSAASSSVGPLSTDARHARPGGGVLPLVQSTSSLVSGGSSTTTGGVGLLNGDSVAHSDPSRGGVSPATTSTPMFGMSLYGPPPEPEPGRLPEPALGPLQANHGVGSHEKGHHVRTDVQLNHKLLSLAESIGATASHEGSRSDSKKSEASIAESKRSLTLGRSESVPASQRGEPIQPTEPNRVEGCTPDVSGYGNPDVYRDWRKWYVDSQDNPGEHGRNRGIPESANNTQAPSGYPAA